MRAPWQQCTSRGKDTQSRMCHLVCSEATLCGCAKQTLTYSRYLTPSFHCLNSNLGWSTTQTMQRLHAWLQSCRQGLSSWTIGDDCSKEGDTLGKLVCLCQTSGSGSLPTAGPVPTTRPMPPRLHCTNTNRILWKGQQVQSSRVTRLALSRPLAKQLLWPAMTTLPKS